MADSTGEPTTVTFHLIKGTGFRTVHIDGIWGGLTPRGLISMGFFSERQPFPREVTYPLTGQRLGDEIKEARVQRQGVLRELEVNAIVDVNTAKSIVKWLQDKIDEHDKAKAEQ